MSNSRTIVNITDFTETVRLSDFLTTFIISTMLCHCICAVNVNKIPYGACAKPSKNIQHWLYKNMAAT